MSRPGGASHGRSARGRARTSPGRSSGFVGDRGMAARPVYIPKQVASSPANVTKQNCPLRARPWHGPDCRWCGDG